MYGSRKNFIVNHVLCLAEIAGRVMTTGGDDLFLKAKAVAHAMAEELNMKEALDDIQPLLLQDEIEARQTLIVSVGRMAKACEALDHLEDYPSRQVLEENIRNILRL